MINIRVPLLEQDYENQTRLFAGQPAIVQRFLESQAQVIADALISETSNIQFSLPDRIVTKVPQSGQYAPISVPPAQRPVYIGGFFRKDMREMLTRRLHELERSPNEAIAASSGLLRYATVVHMVHNSLPAGHAVKYLPNGDEDIPSIPVEDGAPESAITQPGDAIVEEGNGDGRGILQTPFVPAARKFFLPQWVAFDEHGKLLVGSLQEAEAFLQSMQRYATILHRALALAPYISADKEYQRKRYGMLGQLVNQGRTLANFKTMAIICEIKGRSEKQSLNRGLRISLPYFDDQSMEVKHSNLEVIPAGRIMFIPAFVVRAARGEQARVAQDTRLNASTRIHLLAQLKRLETAFES